MNKKKMVGIIVVTAITAAALTFSLTSTIFGLHRVTSAAEYDKLNAALTALQKNFYLEVDSDSMVESAIAAAAKSLEDPYTVYMSSQEWDDFKEQLSGKYTGIGVTVGGGKDEDDNSIVVVSPMKDSPAMEAGIRAGDKIIKVDGEEVNYDTLDYAVTLMRGPAGESVTVTVMHADGSVEDYDIIRRVITIESVAHEVVEDYGVIEISSFDEETDKEFMRALNDLLAQDVKGLIIDLRYNGGGLVNVAANIADRLMDQGVIVYTENRAGDRNYIESKGKGLDMPIVLLINKGSASSSEILAGALRDSGTAVLVGETTFGKGLVQNFVTFGDGSAMKITTERYFTPNGHDINKVGIQPDIEVEITEQDLPIETRYDDPQFTKALEKIKSMQ